MYSIVFIHGLGGHPKKTWEGPQATALVSDDEDERAVRKQSRLLGEIRTRLRSQSPGPSSIPRGSLAFWPADFLPKDIPNARILTYGYKADIVSGFFQANNKNSLSQHSRDLSVKLEREIENQHPIIFVAHSLGGIIIKDVSKYLSYKILMNSQVVDLACRLFAAPIGFELVLSLSYSSGHRIVGVRSQIGEKSLQI